MIDLHKPANRGTVMSATYLKVIAPTRYWEDAKINGQKDVDGTFWQQRSDIIRRALEALPDE